MKASILLIPVFLMTLFATAVHAVGDTLTELIQHGLSDLAATTGNRELCVITNASYVRPGGMATEPFVDSIQELTGCSIGKGNLLFFHSPINADLKIAIVRLDTFESVTITSNGQSNVKHGPVSLAFDRLNESDAWNDIETALGDDAAFKIVAMAYHAAAGAPYDFMKCAELHNHICPGGTSGYFIAHYILDRFPLGDGEEYTYISCPSWCKDDFIQSILDLTAGKRGFFVKGISEANEKRLPNPDTAGILIVSHADGATATAYVLAYDNARARELSGAGDMKGIQSTIRMITDLIPYYSQPEKLVSVTAEYAIDSGTVKRLTEAGVNPYTELGYSR